MRYLNFLFYLETKDSTEFSGIETSPLFFKGSVGKKAPMEAS